LVAWVCAVIHRTFSQPMKYGCLDIQGDAANPWVSGIPGCLESFQPANEVRVS
jgi:hypothetical protein